MKTYRDLLEKKNVMTALLPLKTNIKQWIKDNKEIDVIVLSHKKDKKANMWRVEIDTKGWTASDLEVVALDIKQDGGSVA